MHHRTWGSLAYSDLQRMEQCKYQRRLGQLDQPVELRFKNACLRRSQIQWWFTGISRILLLLLEQYTVAFISGWLVPLFLHCRRRPSEQPQGLRFHLALHERLLSGVGFLIPRLNLYFIQLLRVCLKIESTCVNTLINNTMWVKSKKAFENRWKVFFSL